MNLCLFRDKQDRTNWLVRLLQWRITPSEYISRDCGLAWFDKQAHFNTRAPIVSQRFTWSTVIVQMVVWSSSSFTLVIHPSKPSNRHVTFAHSDPTQTFCGEILNLIHFPNNSRTKSNRKLFSFCTQSFPCWAELPSISITLVQLYLFSPIVISMIFR